MDNLGVSIKSCDEMLETLDIHVCNICVEFSTTILSAPSKRHKKKDETPSKNYVKKIKECTYSQGRPVHQTKSRKGI